MSERFYIRFNLHKSGVDRDVPWVTPDLFQMSEREVLEYARQCDAMQEEKAFVLREAFKAETEALFGKKVLFLGDSITSDRLSYRTIVTKAASLNAQDGSVSSGTTASLLLGIRNRLLGFDGDLVSVMLGANDSLHFGMTERIPFVSPAEYERNLSSIIQWAKAKSDKVLMIEIPPVMEHLFLKRYGEERIHTNEHVKHYNEIVRRIAEKEQVSLLETGWLSEQEAYFEPDGIHLSPLGHEELAKHWLQYAAKE